ELARVCRKGGRLGLCTWSHGGTIEEWFQVMRPYMPPPPANPPPSPFEWGRPERLRELLGGAFDLEFEEGVTTLQMPNGKGVWDLFVEGYGPTRTTAAGCDPESRAGLERSGLSVCPLMTQSGHSYSTVASTTGVTGRASPPLRARRICRRRPSAWRCPHRACSTGGTSS